MSTFIIAEMSANHNGKLSLALDTIKAAKEAGADAVKIQTYTADTLTLNCDNKYFQLTSLLFLSHILSNIFLTRNLI